MPGTRIRPDRYGSVALDVITRSPAGDAANIIGGIADVLEDKPNRSHRSSIDHLGDLATVWLYRDDKQIKQITYREESASRVTRLPFVRSEVAGWRGPKADNVRCESVSAVVGDDKR